MGRRLLTILLIVFVQIVGASMVNPILPLYAQSEFGMEPQGITLLLTAFFAAQFLAGPYIGRLSDQQGRLPILIISQIVTEASSDHCLMQRRLSLLPPQLDRAQ